eukprot:11370246-Heterocapsa_arctica.AAC.1
MLGAVEQLPLAGREASGPHLLAHHAAARKAIRDVGAVHRRRGGSSRAGSRPRNTATSCHSQ